MKIRFTVKDNIEYPYTFNSFNVLLINTSCYFNFDERIFFRNIALPQLNLKIGRCSRVYIIEYYWCVSLAMWLQCYWKNQNWFHHSIIFDSYRYGFDIDVIEEKSIKPLVMEVFKETFLIDTIIQAISDGLRDDLTTATPFQMSSVIRSCELKWRKVYCFGDFRSTIDDNDNRQRRFYRAFDFCHFYWFI